MIKHYKELDITLEEKIDSLILFLKTNLGILMGFYKPNSMMGILDHKALSTQDISELLEDLTDYKVALNKVATLNEQIGLSHFLFKLQALCK